MPVPAQANASADNRTADDGAAPWTALDTDGKRRRLLDAAETVFARDGLDAPVPAIAAAAGAGVGSVYRAFASKEEIVCALAVERLHWVTRRARAALEERDPWAALERLLCDIAERQRADGVLGEAFAAAFRRPDLAQPLAVASAAVDRVLDRARQIGALRAEITTEELRGLFAGLRAADAAQAGSGAKLLELVLAGLRG
jgi:AcrR family transcriptional regulator